ncbi:hypothetical protein DHX103_12155 [Planococcus sp. X10-3]|uniref:hypothetical protein n=1 Tax=Planococcus sp. X10-3 TaxID=3061240 RepID=UPI003BB06B4F
MELPYGISGFYNSDEPKPPEMDVVKYKELCYKIAKDLEAESPEFVESLYPANFYKAVFQLPEKKICLVMNKHYPFLAFAKTAEAERIEFIDYPPGNEAMPEGFTVLPTAELEAPVPKTMDDLPDLRLNKGELDQIKYWKPETIGQIIFNYWD